MLEEDVSGLRPLELGLLYGTFALADRIINTKGVYLVKEEIGTLYSVKWYDVTDYEGSRLRFDRSPMVLLTLTDKRMIEWDSTKAFCQSPLITEWKKCYTQCSKPLMIIWSILRMIYIFLWFQYDSVYRKPLPINYYNVV